MIANRVVSRILSRSGGQLPAASACSHHHARSRNSSSAAAATDTSSSPPEAAPSKSPHSMYMWGTSKKGSIPLNLLQGASAASSGGMFSGEDKIVDHPMKLNLEKGALNEFLSENAGDASLDKVFCGASGTALLLSDGRCFVMGSNKNGELGYVLNHF